MPPISDPSRAASKTSNTVRDKRVAAAIESVHRAEFRPLDASLREMVDDALVRVIEDLDVGPDARVLVVEPYSGYLPVMLSKLGREVTVVCSHPARATVLAEQLQRAETKNVRMSTFVQDREDEHEPCYDRIVVLQPASEELGPVLTGLLSTRGRAIWSVDKNVPPRRVRRLLRVDESTAFEEDLDLVRFMPLLGDMLVEAGVVLRQEVAYAVHAASERGTRLGEELIARGAMTEPDLYRVLAEQRKLPFARAAYVLERLDIDLVRQLPRKVLDHFKFVPIEDKDGQISVATPDIDLPVWEVQAVFDGADIVPELVTPGDMQLLWTAIDLGVVHRSQASAGSQAVAVIASGEARTDMRRAEGMFEAILLDAVADRASDVHLESYENGSRLRFRVDGALRDVSHYQMTSDEFVALIGLIKRAANLDPEQRRVPQGGRLFRRVGDDGLELRVATQPTVCHESVVIRIVRQDREPRSIDQLGFDADVAGRYRRVLQERQGLVLVAGACGTGKTTTLYGALQQLIQDPSRKVVTIEDPIERALTGVQQTQVDRADGLDFGDAMRAILRQDPDVIVIDEIRDHATALAAVRAARSGHLVLAAMHANDTADAVQRLADFGIAQSAIANELLAVFAQRLVRGICRACGQPASPSPELLAEAFPAGAPDGFRCFEGKGCEQCDGIGTRGRVPLVECLAVDAQVQRAIRMAAIGGGLRGEVREDAARSLRDAALALVADGVVTLADLREVLSAEQLRWIG